MGGKRINVDQKRLTQTINDLENSQTFINLLSLQTAVSNSVYGREIGISPINVYAYIKKWNIPVKTKQGKRGDGFKRMRDTTNVVRVPRADKIKGDAQGQEWVKDVRSHMGFLCGKKVSRFEKPLKKLGEGSLRAAISLKCVECCGGETEEIKSCTCTDCPLFYFRPYKQNDDHLANIEIDDEFKEPNNNLTS